MENNSKILHELKDISPLLMQFQNRNPYKVSLTYFDHLADNIVEKIKSGAEPAFSFTKENPYSAPANYFEILPAIIMQQTKQNKLESEVFEEMEELSPLLNTISKQPPYSVPDGYLSSISWKNSEIIEKKAAVISFGGSRKVFKYLAAAVIAGILTIGMFVFTGKQPANTAQVDTAKAASEVKNLSEQEIIDFLKTTSPTENIVSNVSSSNPKDNDITHSVSEMSDKEIQQFLQENGEQVEM